MSSPFTTPVSKSPSARSARAAAFASVAGWSFDLFDLFLLLYVAGPVGKMIFPATSPTLSIAAVFGSFAVSIVMRPAGAAIFGELADRKGRKNIMVFVMAGVGISTAAMGLVPTYAAIGAASPIIFLALRIIQGLFVGGVTATTHTLGTESIGARWRGLMSGLIGGGGAGIGAALASLDYIVINRFFPGAAFGEWGWRVLFFTGLLGAALSLFVLRNVEESPMWQSGGSAGSAKRVPFRELIAGPRRKVFAINVAVAAGAGAQYYLTSGFMPTLLGEVVPVEPAARGAILLASSLIVVIAAVAAGELSEHIGRRRTMLAIGCLNVIALPAVLWAIAATGADGVSLIALLCMLLAFLANAAYAPVMIFLNERYPTALRSRGTAVCWNVGFMLGGLTPTFVNLLSPELSDVPSRLMVFLVVACLVFVVAALASPETRGALDRRDCAAAPVPTDRTTTVEADG
ncbi:MFS transporter [Saccharopolyspora phatthalungensis]|uniref:MFS family permease n=1 Tax=Saccharopolyspora phatthalungensis TaxID=664693 RepID=A0A840QKF5_9PSEU|nr:MFS transporter [Saccharopolyspora phatthalungensis]MBB5158863.1 MFS family permease [Saccharopolyspora phatthalungensis]